MRGAKGGVVVPTQWQVLGAGGTPCLAGCWQVIDMHAAGSFPGRRVGQGEHAQQRGDATVQGEAST